MSRRGRENDRYKVICRLAHSDAQRTEPNRAPKKSLFAVVANGFDGATFHCLFAGVFFGFISWLFDHKRVAIILVHAEMIRGCQNAGVAGDALAIDIEAAWDVLIILVCFISHCPYKLIGEFFLVTTQSSLYS